MIDEGIPVDVHDDGDGYVKLSLEGHDFLRVHRSRILKHGHRAGTEYNCSQFGIPSTPTPARSPGTARSGNAKPLHPDGTGPDEGRIGERLARSLQFNATRGKAVSTLTRISNADLEVRSDGRTVHGLVLPFDAPATITEGRQSYVERFATGTFAKLTANPAQIGRVKLLAQHNRSSNPLGRAVELREDTAGLVGCVPRLSDSGGRRGPRTRP